MVMVVLVTTDSGVDDSENDGTPTPPTTPFPHPAQPDIVCNYPHPTCLPTTCVCGVIIIPIEYLLTLLCGTTYPLSLFATFLYTHIFGLPF